MTDWWNRALGDSASLWLSPKYLGWLLDGWWMTTVASLVVIACATVLGIVFAALRSSPNAWWQRATGVYLSVFRNTPLLVQLFFWYFGVPALLPRPLVEWLNSPHVLALGGWSLGWPSYEVIAAIVGMVFYATAYVGEEIRAGLNGVPKSQLDTAMALGMRRWQSLRYIVLPQALKIVIPSLFGQYMNIVKNTSLGMAVGLAELSYRSRQAEAETFQSFQVYGVATLLYVVLIALLEVASRQVGRQRSAGGAGIPATS